MFFGITPPDREWLGFTYKMATGAFAGSDTPEEVEQLTDFIPKYTTRRTDLQKHIAARDSLRVGP